MKEASSSISDAGLAMASQGGDKRAFVEVVRRHQAMVSGITLGILGDFAAGEDAAQEAFVIAWTKIGELREGEKLRPWLAQIARNSALKQLRERPPRGVVQPLDEASLEMPSLTSPDQLAVTEEEAVLVREALANLPESYRLPLTLFYRQENSVREVAAILDLSEDAVKQRLARGRELLRDRMTGLLENALRSTTPGAVFTIAVAAAIGALTSPATVAASAFSTAAVAAAQSAVPVTAAPAAIANLPAPAAAVMTTTKFPLVTAAAVALACLPVGYAVHPGTQRLFLGSRDSSRSTPQIQPAVKPPDFSGSLLFEEWTRLHEEHGHDAAAMPVLYKAISEIKDTFRRRSFRAALIAEWGQVDPIGGFDFFLKEGGDSNARNQLFREWLARDPQAAMAKLKSAGKAADSVARDLLPEIARSAPEEVSAIAARLQTSDDPWTHPVQDAFGILAEKDLASAKAAAENLTGANRLQALEGVAKTWAKQDLDAVIAWTRTLADDVDKDAVLRSALMGLASVNPLAALEKANLVPPGGRPHYFADTTAARLLREIGDKDLDTAAKWLRDHPGKIPSSDAVGLSEAVARRLKANPISFLNAHLAQGTLEVLNDALHSCLINDSRPEIGTVWEWLKAHPDHPQTKGLREAVLGSAGWQNPRLALAISKDIPATPEGNEAMQNLAQSLLNGGNRMGGLEGLLREAPERLREKLIQMSFSFLRPEHLEDPARWIPRLDSLPPEARPQGITSLAGAWASQDPQGAAGWAQALPDGESRTRAIQSVAESWMKRDSFAASDWVAQLPPGAERDSGAVAIIQEIRKDSPQEAWEWAMSISAESIRLTSAQEVLTAQAQRDPGWALGQIESSHLSEDQKAVLRSAIPATPGTAR